VNSPRPEPPPAIPDRVPAEGFAGVLALALDAGEMGCFEWNIQTGEIWWSDNLEAIHGLPPGTFRGTFESFQALIHPDDRQRVLDTIRRSVEDGSSYEAEFRSANLDGSEHWLMGKGRALADEHGQSSRMVGICMDVTQRKRAEEATREADRRKDEFLAMISHEIRNPLAAIVSSSALLEQVGSTDPVVSKASGMIRRQTEQLTRILDDLLDISRMTAGKLTLRQTNLDLAALARRCFDELAGRQLFERHRHELRLERAHVSGDSVRLEQVLTNLLTNAAKYTPAGGTISVEVRAEGDQAILGVRDTGIGIAPDLLPRVFDLFVQDESALDRGDGGLGVGLSIVRRLVEAHGGRVTAESAGLNQGAGFVVRLPLADRPVQQNDRLAPGGSPAITRRILVVDDNDDAREALVFLLRRVGHQAYEAEDGPGGLESASRLRPDVVLVDIGLPGFDGFEFARRIRASGSTTRLIAMTGYGQPSFRARGAEAGFDAYLVKPVPFGVLLQEVQGARP
jgi:PAS domain S-box-containing protein